VEHSRSSLFKKILIGGLFCALLAGGIWSCAGGQLSSTYFSNAAIQPYQDSDMVDMLPLYERNIYWVDVNPDSSGFKFHMKYRTSSFDNPFDFGKLYTYVLREKGRFVGFVSFYMKKPTVGLVLYLLVDETYRGKRYGQKLLEFAIAELKKMGARKVKLVTRPHNVASHALYKRVGFHETSRNEKFSYFEYGIK
jgi:ribosomal protein S18 acetylase RimI-like enzyme